MLILSSANVNINKAEHAVQSYSAGIGGRGRWNGRDLVLHCTLHSRFIKSLKKFLSFWLQSGLLIIKISCNQIEVVTLASKAVLQLLQKTYFSP